MKKLLDTSPHRYPPADAEALAAQLRSREDMGWSYTVTPDQHADLAVIVVRDEQGEYAGTW